MAYLPSFSQSRQLEPLALHAFPLQHTAYTQSSGPSVLLYRELAAILFQMIVFAIQRFPRPIDDL